MIKILTTAVALLVPVFALAATPRTEHTFQLADDEARPAATLDDASWLVGSWNGSAFGQKFEETWNSPSAGTMVGLFKLYDENAVTFYELMLLVVEDGTLHLLVKHFNPDFSAWEEKQDYIRFSLVKLEPNALHFGGLSFYRHSDNSIEAFIVMRNGEEVSEQKLVFDRTHVAE